MNKAEDLIRIFDELLARDDQDDGPKMITPNYRKWISQVKGSVELKALTERIRQRNLGD